jgi:hypothetical protein
MRKPKKDGWQRKRQLKRQKNAAKSKEIVIITIYNKQKTREKNENRTAL